MSEVATEEKVRQMETGRRGDGWQAEKSAMTRRSIMDAAVTCFVERGYANTTTAVIAEEAGVSRGAMMHHFPARQAVLNAVIEHLHQRRIEEYSALMKGLDNPDRRLTKKSIRASVEAAWRYVNMPTFIAYQELQNASRTDPELREMMQSLEKEYERHYNETVKEVFPHWRDLEILETANDVVHFMMRGMATSHMCTRKQQRVRRVIDYLTEQLYRFYTESAGPEK